jgi:hypothetical protein
MRGGFRPRLQCAEPAQLGRSRAGAGRGGRRARAGAITARGARGTLPSSRGRAGDFPAPAGHAPTGCRRRGRCRGGGEGGAADASAGQRSLDGDSFRADSLGTHDGQTAESARSSPVRHVPRRAGERTSRIASEGAPGRAEGSGASSAEAGGRASCGHLCVRYACRLASRPRRIRASPPRGVRFGSSHRHPEGFAWQTSCR